MVWRRVSGPVVQLENLGPGKVSFEAPPDEAVLRFELEVTDQHGLKDSDHVVVNVSGSNVFPLAEAGPDRSVLEGETVTLNGLGSIDHDGEIESYLWKQDKGPPVSFSDPRSYNPTFVAPRVSDEGEDLEFSLSVCDRQGGCGSDSLLVHVADNGVPDYGLFEGADVVLPGYAPGVEAGLRLSGNGVLTAVKVADPKGMAGTAKRPSRLDWPFFDLEIRVASPGDPVEVEVLFDKPIPEGYTWVKHNGAWQDYSRHSRISRDRRTVTLTLVDGGIGDDDGFDFPNGVILDPGGPALLSTEDSDQASSSPPSSSGGGGGGGGGCVCTESAGASLDWVLLMLVPVLLKVFAVRLWRRDS
jgi:hypothetical protein